MADRVIKLSTLLHCAMWYAALMAVIKRGSRQPVCFWPGVFSHVQKWVRNERQNFWTGDFMLVKSVNLMTPGLLGGFSSLLRTRQLSGSVTEPNHKSPLAWHEIIFICSSQFFAPSGLSHLHCFSANETECWPHEPAHQFTARLNGFVWDAFLRLSCGRRLFVCIYIHHR